MGTQSSEPPAEKPFLSEERIASLLLEEKPVPFDYQNWLKLRKLKKKPVRRARQEVLGAQGSHFTVHVRQNIDHPNRFCVVLMVRTESHEYCLLRCDRHPNPHLNQFESRRRQGVRKVPGDTPHVHVITERYQSIIGVREDGYAEPSKEFDCVTSAMGYFLSRHGFRFVGGEYDCPWPLLKDVQND